MNGYIRNKTPNWMHVMKRAVTPGGKITLTELYKQYGAKNSLKEGADFVEWLKKVKLKDMDKWQVVFTEELMAESVSGTAEVMEETVEVSKETISPRVPTKGISVTDLVELPVRKAKDALDKVTDLKTLQFALQEASVRAGKDSLCRLIRSRIKQINQVSAR